MDGVLADVTHSYRKAAVETVRQLSLEAECGAPAPTAQWIERMKAAGGFNNDWDLSRALVRGCLYYGSAFDPVQYASDLHDAGGGPQSVVKVLGAPIRHSVLGADPVAGDRVQRVFQEFYLGEELFRRLYGLERETVVDADGGLINDETVIVDVPHLDALSTVPLAVATGRPHQEMVYTLEKFGIARFFHCTVNHDDVVAAGARGKPDPWILLETRQKLGLTGTERIAYVGDMPDDMKAARAAGFYAIGFCAHGTSMSNALVEAGSEIVVFSPSELVSVCQ